MPDDFTLTPDDDDTDRPHRSQPVRVVSSGLAPTAALQKHARATPPACVPCAACGAMILHGQTTRQERLALAVQARCFAPTWETGQALPTLYESRAYPVHQCARAGRS